jgi:dihydrodipicolinate synthase/N-acetylneuraminate lyase
MASDLRQSFNARGVYVFVMTPMKLSKTRQGKYEVNLEGMEGNIRHFAGIKGDKTMVICGGSGEFYSLSASEVREIGAAAVEGAQGRCQIVSGIGGSTRSAVKMAASAQEVGCDGVLVMPHDPIVARGEKKIWEHHQTIGQAIDIGYLPFRAPRQLISIGLVRKFAGQKKVVAIKEESGAIDWVRTGRIATDHSVPIITGGGENMVPYYYLAGAVGFTTGMANLTLPKSIQLHNAAIKSRWKSAMEQRDYFESLTALRSELGTPMLKSGLEMMGLAGGPVRDTRAQYSTTEAGHILDTTGRRRVRSLLKKKGVL